jgi:hypothetical protein
LTDLVFYTYETEYVKKLPKDTFHIICIANVNDNFPYIV